MLLDAQLQFSDAQAVTAAAGSDNIIDLGAVRDIGTGQPLWIVVVVTTAMTDGSSDSTVTVALEGDSTTTITPDATADIGLIPAVSAAGDTFFFGLDPNLPPLRYRYIRLKYTPNNGNLSAGAFDAFLTSNIQRWKAYAKNYPITG